MQRRAIALVLFAAACGGASPAGHVRFHNQPPVTEVNDRRNVKEKPEDRKFYRYLNRFDTHYHRRLTRWMEMRARRRATNVNSIDEVPNSTWFTNRIGARDLSIPDIVRGPNEIGSPEAHLPLVIKSSKVGGTAPGFIVEDQRGKKFLLKFDDPRFPESETAADIIGQRLLWAAGYNVPEDHIVYIKRHDVVVSKDAVIKDAMGQEKPMTKAFLDMQFARVGVAEDGTIRALASLYLPGVPIGGHPKEGVRADDPNDRIPHEDRRELRGAYIIFSWLDHSDIKEDNFIDIYAEDPGNPKHHYVVHYLLDFGKALGVQGHTARNRTLGHAYHFDFGDAGKSMVTLGLWKRPWEGRRWPEDIKGVGVFESHTFYPGRWKPNTPSYVPFFDVDRFDGFWAAKIVMRYTTAQIRAAVEQGRFSDPRAVDYLTKTLVERQHKVGRYWFDKVAPLDRFRVESLGGKSQLCFEDLALRYGIAGSTSQHTRYRFRAYDGDGRELRWHAEGQGSASGRACTEAPVAPGTDGYTILRIDVERPGRDLPGVNVHLARAPRGGELRVIGLRRL